MSDLNILHEIQTLKNGTRKEIDFDEYHVAFSHDNFKGNDIVASHGKIKLIEEGFNIAEFLGITNK